MRNHDCSFTRLCVSTTSIRDRSVQLIHGRQQAIEAASIHSRQQAIEAAFDAFAAHVVRLEQHPPGLSGNVDVVAACTFFNHVHSALRLAECGLFSDAIHSARIAVELVAVHWLRQFNWSMAEKQLRVTSQRPWEVIGRLAHLGIDVKPLESLYAICSEMARSGAYRRQDRGNGPAGGGLNIGGRFSPADQKHLIGMVPVLINLYLGRPDAGAKSGRTHDLGTACMAVPEGGRAMGGGADRPRSGWEALHSIDGMSRIASSMSDEKFERLRALAESTGPETVQRFREMAKRVGRE